MVIQVEKECSHHVRNNFRQNFQNNGEFADQSVFHIHFHLIPRYENDIDGFGYKWETHEDILNNDAKQQIAEQIQAQF